MYICLCNAITDKQIRHAARSGVRDLWGLQHELGVATACGSCKEYAMAIIRESRADDESGRFRPIVYRPSAA